jgi:hypothetical protein
MVLHMIGHPVATEPRWQDRHRALRTGRCDGIITSLPIFAPIMGIRCFCKYFYLRPL